jgi:hypothetical protein
MIMRPYSILVFNYLLIVFAYPKGKLHLEGQFDLFLYRDYANTTRGTS